MNHSIKSKILMALSLIFGSLHSVPLAVSNPRVVKVTGGAAFTVALFDDGTLKAWGSNALGEIGVPRAEETAAQSSSSSAKTTGINLSSRPITVPGVKNIKDISSGGFHTLALTTAGSVYGWGHNYRLVVRSAISPNAEDIVEPIKMEDASNTARIYTTFDGSFIVQSDGQVLVRGESWTLFDPNVLTPFEKLKNAREIRGGFAAMIALLDNGQVKVRSLEKHLKLVKGLSDIVAVAAGSAESHKLALRKDGTVWAWGYNPIGQFGNGSTSEKYFDVPVLVPGLKNVVQIAAGVDHSMALLKDGTVRTWGWNHYGQLGNGTEKDAKRPIEVKNLKDVVYIAAGATHSMAILKDGTLKTWGWNRDGQLGNGTTQDSSLPVTVKLF
jgi:alpha-tubulin suppressor-like RCC1 family protein